MSSTWHPPIFGLSCLLTAAMALGQAGCSAGGGAILGQEQKQQAKPAANPTKIANPPHKPPPDAAGAKRDDNRRPLNDPLLKRFGELLHGADDLGTQDRDTARRILEEADPLLTRIKQENRRAMERANRPPKIVVPKSKKPARADEKGAGPVKKADPPAAPGKHAAAEPGK